MGCVQCKDKEAAKFTEDRDTGLSQSAVGYRFGVDPTPQHYPSFGEVVGVTGVSAIPNYNNFHSAAVTQGVTVFGGVSTATHQGTLRTRGGTGNTSSIRVFRHYLTTICYVSFSI